MQTHAEPECTLAIQLETSEENRMQDETKINYGVMNYIIVEHLIKLMDKSNVMVIFEW